MSKKRTVSVKCKICGHWNNVFVTELRGKSYRSDRHCMYCNDPIIVPPDWSISRD